MWHLKNMEAEEAAAEKAKAEFLAFCESRNFDLDLERDVEISKLRMRRDPRWAELAAGLPGWDGMDPKSFNDWNFPKEDPGHYRRYMDAWYWWIKQPAQKAFADQINPIMNEFAKALSKESRDRIDKKSKG